MRFHPPAERVRLEVLDASDVSVQMTQVSHGERLLEQAFRIRTPSVRPTDLVHRHPNDRVVIERQRGDLVDGTQTIVWPHLQNRLDVASAAA